MDFFLVHFFSALNLPAVRYLLSGLNSPQIPSNYLKSPPIPSNPLKSLLTLWNPFEFTHISSNVFSFNFLTNVHFANMFQQQKSIRKNSKILYSIAKLTLSNVLISLFFDVDADQNIAALILTVFFWFQCQTFFCFTHQIRAFFWGGYSPPRLFSFF